MSESFLTPLCNIKLKILNHIFHVFEVDERFHFLKTLSVKFVQGYLILFLQWLVNGSIKEYE